MPPIAVRVAHGKPVPAVGMAICIPVDDGRDYLDFGTIVETSKYGDGPMIMRIQLSDGIEIADASYKP